MCFFLGTPIHVEILLTLLIEDQYDYKKLVLVSLLKKNVYYIYRKIQVVIDQNWEFYEVLATYLNEKRSWGTIFMAEQDLDTTFYRTKKKKIIIYAIYVIPHISNRILDVF